MFVRAFRRVAPIATLLATAAQAQPIQSPTQPAETATTATASVAETRTATEATDQIIAAPEAPFEYEVPLEDVASTTAEEPRTEAVVVTGSRTEKRLSEAPVATEVITRREIESSGAENLGDLLEQHPGVEMERTTRGSGIRLQGLDPEYVLVLIDGERQTGKIGGGVDPGRFSLEDVQQVEIVKGGSSALYGADAIGGVINIITRQPKKPLEGDARAVYGSFNTFDLTGGAGTRRGDFSARLDGGWHRADPFDLTPNDVGTTGAGYSDVNGGLRGEYRFTQDAKIGARVSYRLLDQSSIDAEPGTNAIFDREQRTEVWSARASPEILFEDAKLRLSAHYQKFRLQIVQDQRGDDARDTYEDIGQDIAEAQLQYDRTLFEKHEVTVGIEGLLERQTGAILAGGEGDRQRGAAYLQDEWTILEKEPLLAIVPGIRADADSQFGARVSPKIAARIDPYEGFAIRASYGLGFRAPTFEELYLNFQNPGSGYEVAGNPDLKPEDSQSAQIGADVDLASWLAVSVSGFLHDIDNLIFTRRVREANAMQLARFEYVNVSSAFTRGFEAIAGVKPIEPLLIELGYAFTDTRDNENNRPLEGRARHKGTLRLGLRNKKLGLDASIRSSLIGERPFYRDIDADGREDEETAEPYVSMDFRIAKSLGEHLSLFLGAENIFDAGDAAFLPIAPRAFYGGIAGRFALDEEEGAP